MRVLRRFVLWLLVTAAVVVVAVAVLLGAILLTDTGRQVAGRQIVAALRQAGIELDVRRVGGLPGRTLELDGVRIAVGGRTMARVARIGISYSPLELLRGRIGLGPITVVRPRVRLVRRDGRWEVPWEGSSRGGVGWRFPPVRVSGLRVVHGRFDVVVDDANGRRRLGVTRLDARLAAHFGFRRRRVRVASLTFDPRGIALRHVRASGTVGLEGGSVCAEQVDIASPGSRVTVSGCVEPGEGALGRLALERLDATELRALWPASPLSAPLAGTVAVSGPWHAVRAELGAQLDAGRVTGHVVLDLEHRPVLYVAELEVADVDPAQIVAGGVSGRFNGSLHAEGSPEAIERWRVVLNDSRIAGRQVDSFRARGRANARAHRLRAQVVVPAGTASLQARVTHDRGVQYEFVSRANIARLDALVPGIPGHGRIRASGSASGPGLRPSRGALRLALSDADALGVWIDSGTAEVDLRDDRLVLSGVTVDGPGVSVAAQGTVDLKERNADVSLTIAGELHELGLESDAALGGAVEATATVHGPLEALSLDATLRAEAPGIGGVRADNARVTITGRALGSGTGDHRLEGELSVTGLRIGELAPRDGHSTIVWTAGTAGHRLEALATARQGADVTERIRLVLLYAGGRLGGELQDLMLAPPAAGEWELVEPAAFTLDDGVTLEPVRVRSGRQLLSVQGRIARAGANDASVQIDRVEVAPACTAWDIQNCAGTVSGTIQVKGTAALPEVDAQLTVGELRLGAVDYGLLSVDARYAERVLSLDGRVRRAGGEIAAIEGVIPLDLAWSGERQDVGDQPVTGRLRARDLDLTFVRLLAPAEIRAASGRVQVELDLAGVRRAPELTGRVMVMDGSLQLTRLGATYDEIVAGLDVSGHRLQLTDLRATSGKGSLRGSGAVELEGLTAERFDLTIQLQQFLAVKNHGTEAVVTGVLHLAGSAAAPTLTGGVQVDRAVLRLPRFVAPTDPGTVVDPTITVVGRRQELQPVAETEQPMSGFADRLLIDIGVWLPGNAWIRRHDANVEVGGELHVVKQPGQALGQRGSLKALRGWYAFQGRRFTLREGNIVFPGEHEEPTLDVTGAYRAREYTVVARVQGPSSKPTLDLWSEPALDQADILAVLLFGKPVGRLSGAQAAGLQEQTLALASGYAVGELSASVRDALGLDTLEVQLPQGETGDGQFTVGRHLTRDVFVSFAHQFGSSIAEVVSAEYAVTPKISIRGSTSTLGNTAVDFFIHHRY